MNNHKSIKIIAALIIVGIVVGLLAPSNNWKQFTFKNMNQVKTNKKNVYIYIDDVYHKVNPKKGEAYIGKEERTMIPFRAVNELLGLEVGWNQKNRVAAVRTSPGGTIIYMPIGSKTSIVEQDGKQKKVNLDTQAVLVNSGGSGKNANYRTYVPLRFLSETLGYQVKYESDSNGHYVRIYTENNGHDGDWDDNNNDNDNDNEKPWEEPTPRPPSENDGEVKEDIPYAWRYHASLQPFREDNWEDLFNQGASYEAREMFNKYYTEQVKVEIVDGKISKDKSPIRFNFGSGEAIGGSLDIEYSGSDARKYGLKIESYVENGPGWNLEGKPDIDEIKKDSNYNNFGGTIRNVYRLYYNTANQKYIDDITGELVSMYDFYMKPSDTIKTTLKLNYGDGDYIIYNITQDVENKYFPKDFFGIDKQWNNETKPIKN